MTNNFYQDFYEFLTFLNEFNTRYLLVGGYTVIGHGYERSTGDMDVWIDVSLDNYNKLKMVFGKFGLPIESIPENKFFDNESFGVFSFGRPPVQIEILTKVKGLEFNSSFLNSVLYTHNESGKPELLINMISYQDLIKSKQAAGRAKDIADIENLRINRGEIGELD